MSSEKLFNFLLAEFNFLTPSFINFSAFLKSFLWADLMDLEEIPIISLDKDSPSSLARCIFLNLLLTSP